MSLMEVIATAITAYVTMDRRGERPVRRRGTVLVGADNVETVVNWVKRLQEEGKK